MSAASPPARKARVVSPAQGRLYDMGRMRAIFIADTTETESQYSISEWWLEPDMKGPGEHLHPEDHVYYVIDGTVSVFVDGNWTSVARGSYVLIPGGTPHDFENRSTARCGFISFNSPGGFELKLPGIVEHFTRNALGDASA